MRNQTWQKNEVEYNCCLTITTFGLTNVSETYERTQLRDLWQHVRWKSYGSNIQTTTCTQNVTRSLKTTAPAANGPHSYKPNE